MTDWVVRMEPSDRASCICDYRKWWWKWLGKMWQHKKMKSGTKYNTAYTDCDVWVSWLHANLLLSTKVETSFSELEGRSASQQKGFLSSKKWGGGSWYLSFAGLITIGSSGLRCDPMVCPLGPGLLLVCPQSRNRPPGYHLVELTQELNEGSVEYIHD